MDTSFANCAIGSDEYLMRWALAHLQEALREGDTEVVKSYRRAVEYLASRQAGSPKAVVIGYRLEGDEPCPDSKQLIAA